MKNVYFFAQTSWSIFISNDSDKTESWDPTGISEGESKIPHTLGITFSQKLIDNYQFKVRVGYKGICLKQDSVSFLHKKKVNLYISYESNSQKI